MFFILTADCCMIFGRTPFSAGNAMHVTFTDEELAFRDEVRAFFGAAVPENI